MVFIAIIGEVRIREFYMKKNIIERLLLGFFGALAMSISGLILTPQKEAPKDHVRPLIIGGQNTPIINGPQIKLFIPKRDPHNLPNDSISNDSISNEPKAPKFH